MQQIDYALKGLASFFKAFVFSFKKGRAIWYAYPLAIALVMFLLLDFVTADFARRAFDFLADTFQIEERSSWMYTLSKWLLKIIFWFLFASINRYLVLILMSPVLAFISEKTEAELSGTHFPFKLEQFIKDVARGVVIALRNLSLEYLCTFGIWLITLFIPVLLPFSAITIIAIQCYFYGFAFIDYNLERRRLKVRDSVGFIRKHKGIALGIGAGFYLLFLIPVLGWIVAPIVSAIAATMTYLQIEGQISASELT